MLPKRLLALTLFAALAVMPARGLRAQWVQTNGPYGGGISCFAAMESNMFAGAYDGAGVFRSTDSGLSWRSASSRIFGVTSICSIGKNIIAAGNDGVYFSTDSGASWNPSANIYTGGGFSSLTGMVAIGKVLFAGVNTENYECTTYLSRDSGKTWIDTGQPPGVITTMVTSKRKIFVGTYGGIFVSTDTGETWEKISNGLTNSSVFSLGIIDTTLFAVSGNNSWTFFQVYISTNEGSTWAPTSDSLPRGVPLALAVSGNDSTHALLVGGTSGVFVSTDNGQTWIDAGLQNTRVPCVAIKGIHFLAGTDNGLFLSNDTNKIWNLVGLSCTDVSSIVASDTNLFAGINNGGVYGYVFRSTNNGESWIQTSYGSWDYEEEPVSVITISGSSLFVRDVDGLTWLSNDNGTSWTRDDSGLKGTRVVAHAVSGENIFVGTDSGVFLSFNNGENWMPVNSGLTASSINDLVIKDSILFAATDSAGVWRRPLSEMVPRYEAYSSPDSLSFGNVMIGKDSTLPFKFRNPGNTAITITSIAFTPSIGLFMLDSIFVPPVTIQPGAFLNFEATFTPLISGVQFDTINIVSEAQEVVIPLNGKGIEGAGVSGTTLSEPSLQIFPNPVSQSTQIALTSPSAGYAEVSIVNMLGVEVARVFSGEVGAGNHSFTWDADRMSEPRGMYECVVRMNGRVETVPVVLVR